MHSSSCVPACVPVHIPAHVRWLLLALAGAALSVHLLPAAAQQAQPAGPLFDRPLRMVVPFSPGGTVDAQARAIALALQQKIGSSVVVDNKPGGGGNIAAATVAHAPASQPMLLVSSINYFVNPVIFKDPGYDTARDFVPIAQLATSPYVYVVAGNSRFNTLAEVVTHARANPGKLAWGFGGVGSPGQFFGIELGRAAGVETNPIPYRGGPELLAAVGGGHIDMVIMTTDTALPLIRDGRLKALASTGDQRNGVLPEVPTVAEQVPGYESLTGFTLLVAAATLAPAKVAGLHQAVGEILASPDYQESLRRAGATVTISPSLDESRDFLQREGRHWQAIAKASGLQVQ
jgi:tripartite-type tricarboxylate transporter receptor subunit TctC